MDAEARAAVDRGVAEPAPEPKDPAARVDDFIRHRLDQLSVRLSHDKDQPIDGAAIGEVRFLRDLAWLKKEYGGIPHPQKRRLVIPLLFLGTAAVMTALVVMRLPAIRVDADILASGVTMRVASPIQLTSLSPLSLMQATQFRTTEVEDPSSGAVFTLEPPLELRPLDTGSLTLSSISIPDNALLSIQTTSDAGTWRVSIEHDAAAISATAAGRVDVSTGGNQQSIGFGRGHPMTLSAAMSPSSRIEALLTPQRVESLLAARRIPVREVKFEETVQEALSGPYGVAQGRGSSILQGSIFNVALGGREVALRPRDVVDLDLATGDVRELRLETEGVRVSLSAEARELRIGRFGGLQTLRPSYLEWLAEHHALKLAWGAAAWLFALFLGGIRWWQASDI